MKLYRPADLSPTSDDRAFAIATWSSSYKSSHFAGVISADDWAEVMRPQLGKLLDRPTTVTVVCHAPQDFLYGFIAGDLSGPVPIVHYVYVKDPFRKDGIARGLFGAIGVDPARLFLYSCRTAIVSRLDDRTAGTSKIPRSRFAPAAARYTNYMERPHDHR